MPPFEYGVEYFSTESVVWGRRVIAASEELARAAVTNHTVAGAVLVRRPAGLGGLREVEPDE